MVVRVAVLWDLLKTLAWHADDAFRYVKLLDSHRLPDGLGPTTALVVIMASFQQGGPGVIHEGASHSLEMKAE